MDRVEPCAALNDLRDVRQYRAVAVSQSRQESVDRTAQCTEPARVRGHACMDWPTRDSLPVRARRRSRSVSIE